MTKTDNNKLETRISGCLINPLSAIILTPITRDNIHVLKPGDWIWDDKMVERRVYKRSLRADKIMEPIGFRQIYILDLTDFDSQLRNKPFMLSDIDSDYHTHTWVNFEENRFYIAAEKE